MLPMGKKDRGAIKQIILYTIVMIVVSLIPVLRQTGDFWIYPITAVIIFLLGALMLYYAIQLYKHQTDKVARQLMLSSVLYITLIQIIYVVDKFLH